MIKLAPGIRFHGGGHINHTFFWHSLSPKHLGGGEHPSSSSKFGTEIHKAWGSVDKLIVDFNAKTAGIQGSGWGWLVWNSQVKGLEYVSTKDQDLVTEKPGVVPLLNIDVWEHAYYLDYKNARPNYLSEIWKVVNWAKVEERFNKATEKKK
mmetsp:Transcript_8302/g.9409  ORF Transcript_8302/g.9409 Transcript_8302/m.9409 type:complete len:151 (-) Transcript_8302:14-466(-)